MSAVASASTFEFDAALHRLGAIQKAAYRYTGHFQVSIESPGCDRIRVTLTPLERVPQWPCDPQQFPNDVLDQQLRELVADETRTLRDFLLAQAFSGLALTDPVGESADFRKDPLGIHHHRTASGVTKSGEGE